MIRLFADGDNEANRRLNALTPAQIQFFPGARLSDLTYAETYGLNHDALKNFMTAAMISHLTAEQLHSLSVEQIRVLGHDDRARRQALLDAGPNHLTQAQRQALLTLTP
jgi:hypothetical protein